MKKTIQPIQTPQLQPSDAASINATHFEEHWSGSSKLKERFQYNLEVTRKDFFFALRKLRLSTQNQRVLDIGFGSGLLMFLFPKSCSLFGTEFSETARKRASERAARQGYAQYSFQNPTPPLPFPYRDNEFDIVIASHVLEHVLEDRQLIEEAIRVLRPGGHFVLIVPLDAKVDNPLSEKDLINPAHITAGHFHVRNYNMASLLERCSNTGASIVMEETDCNVWDWKHSVERRKLGRLGRFAFSATFNVFLSLAPRTWITAINGHCARAGYRARQAVVVLRKHSE